MHSKHLMIIDPSLDTPELESYNSLTSKSPFRTSYHLPAIHNPKSMENKIEKACGLILMGSAASVHDSFQWMKTIEVIINKAIDNKVPILGICFGHQFLAHIFGGTINFLWESTKKVGIRKVKVNNNSFIQESCEGYLLYSHKEGVTQCPKNFDIFGSSSMVEIEAIAHRNLPIWSFQTHIEASKTFAKRIGVNQNNFEKTKSLSNKLLNAFFNKLVT